MSEETSLRDVRLQKLARLRELGADPFRVEKFERTGTAKTILDGFEEEKPVRFAGRVVSYRLMGKAGFAHLSDGDGRIQAYFRRDALGETGWEVYGLLDLGDHVGVEGYLFTTKTGERSIHVDSLTPLSKALHPLPLGKEKDGETFSGLTDVETRYRHRHLDLLANADARRTLIDRARIVSAVRRYFDGAGYLEVETPLLQIEAGGAAARPFVTHYNAYEIDVKLRISLELYLKRIICGDVPAVYEIGRVFRNEGVSNRHNPEFTLLEFYEAYSNLEDMMVRVEECFKSVATKVFGTTKFLLFRGRLIKHSGNEEDPYVMPDDRRLNFSMSEEWRTRPLQTKDMVMIQSKQLGEVDAGDQGFDFELREKEPLVFPSGRTWNVASKGVFLVEQNADTSFIEVPGEATLTTSEGETFTLLRGMYRLAEFPMPVSEEEARQIDADYYEALDVDFGKPWRRVSLLEEIERHTGLTADDLSEFDRAVAAAKRLDVEGKAHALNAHIDFAKERNLGGLIEKLLEVFVEPTLQEPTFVVGYPIETSPLAKKDPNDPRMTRRFEGYVLGREVCNAFSEINDPLDQRARFEQQVREAAKGDDEAHPMDEEFLYALESGMPPTGGCGIGLDRMAMLLTGAEHIREVLFFPFMRPLG